MSEDTGPFVMSRYAKREDLYQAMSDRIESLQDQLKEARSLLREALEYVHQGDPQFNEINVSDVWLDRARKIGGGE